MPMSGWIILWALLILGALVVYALIGLRLLRKAQAVFAQAGHTLEMVEVFGAAVDGLDDLVFDTPVALTATETQKAQWRRGRRLNLIRRKKRKLVRRRRTLIRWGDAHAAPPWV